ncbi:MAG: hypothetical protein ACOYT8_04720 [Candidatus Dependentiae bacterium]
MKLSLLLNLAMVVVITSLISCSEQLATKYECKKNIDNLEYKLHMRLLLDEKDLKENFEAIKSYYLKASECTTALPDEPPQNSNAFTNIFNPTLVLYSESGNPTLDSWRFDYCQYLTKKINTYQTKLEYKKKWLREKSQPFAVLIFIIKKWSQAIARFTLGCASYLIGGFTAKYAIQEKQLKNLTTSLALCVGGSYCIYLAGNALGECVCYNKEINAHLQETELHVNHLKKIHNQLITYSAQLNEKKLLKSNGSQKESPLIPRHAEPQDEEEGTHL